MREPALRCKRCRTRFVAAPYLDGTGYPAYCPTCTVRMRHEHEEQVICGRCHKTFTAIRRDLRKGLPTYCHPCSRIVNHELVTERSSRRPSITQGRMRHWHDTAAKQPSERRFGPATRRRCQVGWDRATHTLKLSPHRKPSTANKGCNPMGRGLYAATLTHHDQGRK